MVHLHWILIKREIILMMPNFVKKLFSEQLKFWISEIRIGRKIEKTPEEFFFKDETFI